MIYDNGTDISTLYDYQYKPINQLTASSAGQIVFDPETDHVYLSSTLSLSSASYLDILLLKLDSLSGAQIWNRWLNVTTLSVNNVLQPIIIVNNYTKFIYVALALKTNNLQIARLAKNGTLDMHQILKTSPNSYQQFDMTTDNRNGNLILVCTSQTTIQEIIFLSSNLAYLRGNFRMHIAQDSGRYRMIAQVDTFFYSLQRNIGFSMTRGFPQMVLGKKSLYPHEIYKHECHIYTEVTGQFSLISNLSLTSISAPSNVIYLNTTSLFFVADPLCRVRNNQIYFNNTYFYPDLSDGYRMTGTLNAITCKSNGGGKLGPSGDFQQALEVVKGNTAQINFGSDMFYMKNCQGDQMGFQSSKIADERASATTSSWNPYITMQQSTTPYYISINAAGTAPYPGVRWMTLYLTANSITSTVYMPLYVYPTVTPNATLTEPDLICADSDQKFPKVFGYPNGYTTGLDDADIDKDNGNMLICGFNENPIQRAIDYRDGNRQPYIALFDLNGQLQWGYSGQALTSEGSYAAACQFGPSQTGVYQLIKLDVQYVMMITKMDYVTGKIQYIKKLQGDFQSDLPITSLKIDFQYNQAYIAAQRFDITNSSYPVSHYIAKVDLNPKFPIQQYYSYVHWLQSNPPYTYFIYSLQILHSQDYIATMGRMYFQPENNNYQAIILQTKTTGLYVASTFILSQTYSAYMLHSLVADDQFIFFAFSTYNPKTLRIVKLQIPSLTKVSSNGHSLIDGSQYSLVSLVNDTNYLYAFAQEPSQYVSYLTKFQKSDLAIISTVLQDSQLFLMIAVGMTGSILSLVGRKWFSPDNLFTYFKQSKVIIFSLLYFSAPIFKQCWDDKSIHACSAISFYLFRSNKLHAYSYLLCECFIYFRSN